MDGWMDGRIDGWPRVVKHTHLCFSLSLYLKKKSEPSSPAEQKQITLTFLMPQIQLGHDGSSFSWAQTERLLGFFVWFSLLEWIWHSPHHDAVFFFSVPFLCQWRSLPVTHLPSPSQQQQQRLPPPTGSVIVKTGGEDKSSSIIHLLTAIKRLGHIMEEGTRYGKLCYCRVLCNN